MELENPEEWDCDDWKEGLSNMDEYAGKEIETELYAGPEEGWSGTWSCKIEILGLTPEDVACKTETAMKRVAEFPALRARVKELEAGRRALLVKAAEAMDGMIIVDPKMPDEELENLVLRAVEGLDEDRISMLPRCLFLSGMTTAEQVAEAIRDQRSTLEEANAALKADYELVRNNLIEARAEVEGLKEYSDGLVKLIEKHGGWHCEKCGLTQISPDWPMCADCGTERPMDEDEEVAYRVATEDDPKQEETSDE